MNLFNLFSYWCASVIFFGKTDAVLIDAQFTLADAEKVAAEIKKSDKKLTVIYVSHVDPDYYFGLEVFKKLRKKTVKTWRSM